MEWASWIKRFEMFYSLSFCSILKNFYPVEKWGRGQFNIFEEEFLLIWTVNGRKAQGAQLCYYRADNWIFIFSRSFLKNKNHEKSSIFSVIIQLRFSAAASDNCHRTIILQIILRHLEKKSRRTNFDRRREEKIQPKEKFQFLAFGPPTSLFCLLLRQKPFKFMGHAFKFIPNNRDIRPMASWLPSNSISLKNRRKKTTCACTWILRKFES